MSTPDRPALPEIEITPEMIEAALVASDIDRPAHICRKEDGWWSIDGSFNLKLAASVLSQMLNK